jgi:hypothetical protein
MTDELPLPEPDGLMHYVHLNGRRPSAWSADQMRAYGAAAVEQEREKWASIVAPEHLVFGDEEWRIRSELAAAIRKGE